MPLLNAWASTLPYTDDRTPRAGTKCAVEDCTEPIRSREEVYLVIERKDDGWVCWRHIARESGPTCPVTVPDE